MSEGDDSGNLPSTYDLSSVFAAKDSREVAELYDHWADDYEQSILSWGYLTPAVTSWFVGRFVEDRGAPVLDAGAGTGLMGDVLATLGYSDLVAIDISENMLAHARGKGVYRQTGRMELGQELDFPTGAFAAVVATGVFAAGHAPPESLDELARVTRNGGSVIFSVRTDVLEDTFGATLERLEEEGRWERLDETRPFSHLPLEDPELKLQVFAYRVR
ncbi:MAG: class I SAM-dependent methyltransferase [Thermoleophilaceae bacterium]|jgi:predicted TPR repeat methyltransferase|nr:class I SAM-dependent methyltransferase [Thermoleophilaceae bacterium]